MSVAAVRSSAIVVPQPLKWQQRAAARLVYLLVRANAATLRFGLHPESQRLMEQKLGPAIFCTWHNRLALSLPIYRKFIRSCDSNRRLAALVSASRDGGLLARILELFEVQPVRGSSSRRGPQALLELTSWADKGFDLAITPDGPRGPRYVVQEGVLALAQLTGRPIYPIHIFLPWKIRLKSWDQFQIPIPFGRCEIKIGNPVRVPRGASDAERAALRVKLETEMRAGTRDA